jgi:hypothetical protein
MTPTARRRRLRALDDRLVPRAAFGLRRAVLAVRGSSGRLQRGPAGAVAGSVGTAVRTEPALAGSVAVVLIAALLVGVFGRGPGADTSASTRHAPAPVNPGPPSVVIGPLPGTSVPSYLTRAAYDLRHVSETAAGRAAYAVVDFRGFLTTRQLGSIVGSIPVTRIFVRLRSRLPTLPLVAETSLARIATVFPELRVQALHSARGFRAASRVSGNTKKNRADRRRYRRVARGAAQEAAGLAHPATCPCIYAVLVHATAPQLAALARSPRVRVVDPADATIAVNELTAYALDPTARRVVPTGIFGGG